MDNTKPASPTRRELFLLAMTAAVGNVLSDSFGHAAAWMWRGLRPRSVPDIDEARSLFRSLFLVDTSQCGLHGGLVHEQYSNEMHPDIKEGAELAGPLWSQLRSPVWAKHAEMPIRPKDYPLVTIGGPRSNLVSRRLHGFETELGGKVAALPGRSRGRYSFNYTDLSLENSPRRFVARELVAATGRHALHDADRDQVLRAITDSHGMLEADFLLVTSSQNPFARESGRVVDIADLHGQGNKAAGQLLTDPVALEELAALVNDRKIDRIHGFQALYLVPTTHEETRSFVRKGEFHLLDVSPLAPG